MFVNILSYLYIYLFVIDLVVILRVNFRFLKYIWGGWGGEGGFMWFMVVFIS